MKKEAVKKSCQKVERELPCFFEEYILYLKNSSSDLTRLNYLNDIKLFLKSHFNSTDIKIEDIENLKPIDVNRYLSNMEVSASTKSRKKSAITNMLTLLSKRGIIKENISADIDQIKVKKKDTIKKLENGEVAKLLKVIEKDSSKEFKNRNILMFNLFLNYGLRLSEVSQLTIDDFDLENNVFTINRKRNKTVEMPFSDETKDLYLKYINSERKKTEYNELFLSKNHKPLSESGIYEIVMKFTAKATKNGKGLSPHKLRATTATQMIAQGFSIYDVMDILDHSDVSTTQVYADHVKENKKKVLSNFKVYL